MTMVVFVDSRGPSTGLRCSDSLQGGAGCWNWKSCGDFGVLRTASLKPGPWACVCQVLGGKWSQPRGTQMYGGSLCSLHMHISLCSQLSNWSDCHPSSKPRSPETQARVTQVGQK